MPSLNVAPYIKQCIESAMNQTLKNIEIICVDAGSTDGTLEILRQYAERDCRIKIILSEKKSYGYQMNLGLDAASGEYVGILETDDWAEPEMFESLWEIASEYRVDVVKSNYYWYTTKNGEQSTPFENLKACNYNIVFNPLEEKNLFTTTPSIWSGIYCRDMLVKNNIRFNETPGASFQDTSFHFMVCTVAESCYLLKDPFLHYRRDNDSSSVHSASKVYCVSDEMHYYENFLNNNKRYEDKIRLFYQALKYEKYRWNYERLSAQYQFEFLKLMHDEFSRAAGLGSLDETEFSPSAWKAINFIINNPLKYYEETCKTYSTRLQARESYPYTVLKQAEIKNPKVSVIIPAYNYEKYVGKAIESILQQTLEELEIICIDDGSSDGTLDILLSYAANDPRITVCTQINKGLSGARNTGLKVARGQYIDFLDSDDQLTADALENLYYIANIRKLDILYFDGTAVYSTKELEQALPYYLHAYEYSRELPDVLSGAKLFSAMREDKKFRASVCFSLYSKAYLDSCQASFVEGILQEDHIFSTKYLINAGRVAHLNKKYYLRTVHDDSIMTQTKTFRHFYGYLTCVIDLLNYASTLSYDEDLYRQLTAEIYHLINMAKKAYEALPNKESYLKKLDSIEYLYFSHIIFSSEKISHNNEAMIIRKSWSYKIGRLITWLPRKMRGFVRCCEDHGLLYTCRRTLYHLRLKR